MIKLQRPGKWPMITRAILQEDGIHMVDHNGQIRSEVRFKTLKELNDMMKEIDCPIFDAVKEFSDHYYRN